MHKYEQSFKDFFEAEGIPPTIEDIQKMFPLLHIEKAECTTYSVAKDEQKNKHGFDLDFSKKRKIVITMTYSTKPYRTKTFETLFGFLKVHSIIVASIDYGKSMTKHFDKWDKVKK